MKIFLLMLSCLFLIMKTSAQNLVPNGSFEEYYSCPWSNGQVDSCMGWLGMGVVGDPLPGTPDYFNSCAPYVAGVPNNFAGEQAAFEGNAYTGLYTYTWVSFWREIIGTQLQDTMIPGNTYHVSMRVSRGNHTYQANNNAASNKLGVFFSKKKYTLIDPPPVSNFAQLYEDSIIIDTVNWILLHWNFLADSAYTHLYIGNFFDDIHTDTITSGPYPADAYYFIDSINIYCITKNCLSGISEIISNQVMQYNSQTLEIILSKPGNIKLFNVAGQLLRNENLSTGVFSLRKFPPGMYFILFSTKELFIIQKFFLTN